MSSSPSLLPFPSLPLPPHDHTQHAGEVTVQRRRGIPPAVSHIPPSITTNEMTHQQSDFYQNLPYFALATTDKMGRPWATLIAGPPHDRPVTPLNSSTLRISATLSPSNPVGRSFAESDRDPVRLWAGLGVDFRNRRRNKVAGYVGADVAFDGGRLRVTATANENMGNCPKLVSLSSLSLPPSLYPFKII